MNIKIALNVLVTHVILIISLNVMCLNEIVAIKIAMSEQKRNIYTDSLRKKYI